MTRAQAKILGCVQFDSKRPCGACGTTRCATETGKCLACDRYIRAIKAGRFNGTRGHLPSHHVVREPWCDEMSVVHSAAIKRGIKRARAKKDD